MTTISPGLPNLRIAHLEPAAGGGRGPGLVVLFFY
jgi:hypothetical protein